MEKSAIKGQQIQKQSDSQKLFKPIDICLNLKFENSKYVEQTDKDALMVFKDNHQRFQESNIDHSTNFISKEINELKPYDQREIVEDDGLIFKYAKKAKKLAINEKKSDKIQINEKKFDKIQMLCVVTMYNEKISLLEKTLRGIQKNMNGFKDLNIDASQIVIIVIQDGIMKMEGTENPPTDYWKPEKKCMLIPKQEGHEYNFGEKMKNDPPKPSVKAYFSELDGLFDKDDLKTYEKNFQTLRTRQNLIAQEIQKYKSMGRIERVKSNNMLPPSLPKKSALLYQTRINTMNEKDEDMNLSHLYTFFLLKHLNAKKLSSHMWFFEGFCRFLKPKYCCLIDVGTVPDKLGLVNYFRFMESDEQLGGGSGFMGLYFDEEDFQQTKEIEKQRELKAQQEYKDLHYPKDEPTETDDEIKKEIELKAQQDKQDSRYRQDGLTIGRIKYEAWRFMVRFHKWVDVRKAQLFEYNIAHMLDKNFESFFNFSQVLPGAWSVYRYKALSQSQKFRENLLQKQYLKTVLNPSEVFFHVINKKDYRDHKEQNMFLAEDRILCLGLFCQENQRYKLKYIPNAKAKTDAIDDFEQFMNQRRRWINSSWFASDYVLRCYDYHLEKSTHPWWRKHFTIHISMFMGYLSLVNTYFIPTFYYFTFHIMSYQILLPNMEDADWNPIFLTIPGLIPFFYAMFLIYLVFASLNFKANSNESPENTEIFYVISAFFGIYQTLSFAFVVYGIINNYLINFKSQNVQSKYFVDLFLEEVDGVAPVIREFIDNEAQTIQIYFIILIACNIGSFTVIAFFHIFTHHKRVWEIICSTPAYIYYSAAYTHTLVIYSFCNIDDLSWGTKGDLGVSGTKKYYNEKVKFVGQWLFANALFSYILIIINGIWGNKGYVLIFLGGYATLILVFKFIFALLHHFIFYTYRIFLMYRDKKNNQQLYIYMGTQMKKEMKMQQPLVEVVEVQPSQEQLIQR